MTQKRKAQMILPIHMMFFFLVFIISVSFALVIAKENILAKEYVENETVADRMLYVFLNDNTCTQTGLVNSEIISLGIAQGILSKANAEGAKINIEYNNKESSPTIRECLLSFFRKVGYDHTTFAGNPRYYFSVQKKGELHMISAGNIRVDGNENKAYIATLDGKTATISLITKG